MFERLRSWAHAVKRDVVVVYLAARDGRTPLAARLVAFVVAAYALSPIDLIPDFIPVLGYLDDALLVPLGILLALKLTPAPLVAELRARADALLDLPRSRGAAAVILAIWIVLALVVFGWVTQKVQGNG